jgi:glutamyl-tRNA reductase
VGDVDELTVVSLAWPAVATEHRSRSVECARSTDTQFVVSTCLRHDLAQLSPAHHTEAVVRLVDGVDGAVVHREEDAAVHLFRVAAGLESPVLGEREVWTQFRKAVAFAKEGGAVPGLFVRLLDRAVAAGREARELLPVRPHDSMGSLAADVVTDFDVVAVFGSGIMARAVVESLLARPRPPRVVVVARRPDAITMPGVEVRPFGDARAVLGRVDAVVSATSATTRPLRDDTVAEVLAERRDPLTIVDLAMPPDFAPPDAAGVRYVDIDDLADLAGHQPGAPVAEAFVAAQAVGAYRRLRDHAASAPLIRDLVDLADSVVEEVVRRYSGRVDADAGAVLHQAVRAATRRVLADPIAFIHHADAAERAVVADIFRADG